MASIEAMEIVEISLALLIPGFMHAGLRDALFWLGLGIILPTGYAVAYPATYWVMRREQRKERVARRHQLFYSCLSILGAMEENQPELAEGNIAPDFTMRDRGGKATKLSELRGKKNVVVYFYPRDFTPGCTMEATEFSRDYRKFKDAGIEIVGVSPDDEKSHQKFRDKMDISYPLVADTENNVSKKYGVYGLKSFMGREYMGVNRSTFLVDKSGKIVKIFKKVKPAGHSQEVLEAFC